MPVFSHSGTTKTTVRFKLYILKFCFFIFAGLTMLNRGKWAQPYRERLPALDKSSRFDYLMCMQISFSLILFVCCCQ